MKTETKTCANCKIDFIIELDDFAFYEKMQVPPPTWCPDCRSQRRMSWRNERILYKRKCNAPGHSEEIISNYGPHIKSPIYDQKYWWKDEWDGTDVGRDYDFSKPFFVQFKDLLDSAPLPNLSNIQTVGAEYCNYTYQGKNCYLAFAADMNEDSAYLSHSMQNKNSFDLLGSSGNESCYEGVYIHNCNRCAYTYFSNECMDSKLLYNCQNCTDCFACVNLKNAKHHILNKKYSKEEYERKIQEYASGERDKLEKLKNEFWELVIQYPKRFAHIIHSTNVTGDLIVNAKNCKECFDSEGPLEDSTYVTYGVTDIKDVHDAYAIGVFIEQAYEIVSTGDHAQNIIACVMLWSGASCKYSYACRSSSNILGCVALNSKEHCILNKQYSKEEYEELIPKIRKHMDEMPYIDKKGKVYKYGEFFPAELSPFAYNESIAGEYFPLTKEKTKEQGLEWKDQTKKEHQPTKKAKDLPNNIQDANDDILKEIIECEHKEECNEQCTGAFKIIKSELEFYRVLNIPLPRICSNCRHYARLKYRNPFKLHHRKCQCAGTQSENKTYKNQTSHFHDENHCPNEFKTTYTPDREEIVYCEQCYQNETA